MEESLDTEPFGQTVQLQGTVVESINGGTRILLDDTTGVAMVETSLSPESNFDVAQGDCVTVEGEFVETYSDDYQYRIRLQDSERADGSGLL